MPNEAFHATVLNALRRRFAPTSRAANVVPTAATLAAIDMRIVPWNNNGPRRYIVSGTPNALYRQANEKGRDVLCLQLATRHTSLNRPQRGAPLLGSLRVMRQ